MPKEERAGAVPVRFRSVFRSLRPKAIVTHHTIEDRSPDVRDPGPVANRYSRTRSDPLAPVVVGTYGRLLGPEPGTAVVAENVSREPG